MVGSTCSPRCLGKLVIGTTLAFLCLGLTQSALAQNNCIQDEFTQAGNTQTLGCTANDVRIAEAINTRSLDGSSLNTCTPGQTYNFIADFLVQTSSKSTRSNIGLYLGLDSAAISSGALTGKCADNIIGAGDASTHRYLCPHQTGLQPLCGSSHYDEFDASPDNCGDSSSTDPTVYLSAPDGNGNAFVVPNPVTGGSTWASTQVVTVEIDGFTCPNTPGQLVTLPDCTSWQVPGKTLSCVSQGPSYPFVPSGAIPGTTSKCNCSTVTLPIRVQSPGIAVTKNCTTDRGSSDFAGNPSTTSCSLDDPGTSTSNNVTYSVKIDNSSNFGDIAVDQICDSAYGTVYRASGISTSALAACPVAGSIPAADFSCSGLGDVSSTTTCSFHVFQAESKTVTDIITVNFHGLSTTGTVTYLSASSNVVAGVPTAISVISGEAQTTGTITANAESLTDACETVTYSATVANTSTATDETFTLSKVYDNGVDLTQTTTGGVLGTTCGQANGTPLGTLTGYTPANPEGGSLSKVLSVNGGSYTCHFSFQYCHAPGDVVKTAGTCSGSGGTCTTGKVGSACNVNADCDVHCTGIQAPNSITADVKGDENETITLTAGTAPATMCVTFP